MKIYPNNKLTRNFWLYEFIESKLPDEAIALNWQNINTDIVQNIEKIALEAQRIRNTLNANFKSDLKFPELGVRITSGYRCKEWELIRKRTGLSQHTTGGAIDLQVINCSRNQAIELQKWVYEQYKDWQGGLAIKWNEGESIGFVHIDGRTTGAARWVYS
jgi:hypothetical protein